MARLTLIAARRGAAGDAFAMTVEGGRGAPQPAAFAGPHGARVEVRDLFYATPARLKFMKSERAEAMAIAEEVKRQAMAHEAVAFALDLDGRRVLRLPAEHPGPEGRLKRLAAVLGGSSQDNALLIDQEREGVRLSGFAGLPTFKRGNAAHQYLFVNGRPVRDRLLQGALRAAYADFLARDRHPVAALYLELDPDRGGRQCASGQGRGALPRSGAGARADRRRAAPRAWPARAIAPPPRWPPRRWAASGPAARSPRAGFSRLARGRLESARRGHAPAAASPRLPAPRRVTPAWPTSRRPTPRRRVDPTRLPSAPRGRSCTRPISSPRPATAWSSSTSTPRTSGWSMSG